VFVCILVKAITESSGVILNLYTQLYSLHQESFFPPVFNKKQSVSYLMAGQVKSRERGLESKQWVQEK
jgi:hypothetical protein